MELFKLNLSNKSVVTLDEPAILRIPEFKRLLNRDRGSTGDVDGRKKYRAIAEFTFIWYYCSFTSPIFDRSDKERFEESLKISGLASSNIDADVHAAIAAYKKYTNVISLRLYQSALEGCNKLELHFKTIDFDTRNEATGNRENTPKDFISNIKQLKSALMELKELKELVKQDLSKEVKLRGNSKKGNREDPN
jgi:hypothetical protein